MRAAECEEVESWRRLGGEECGYLESGGEGREGRKGRGRGCVARRGEVLGRGDEGMKGRRKCLGWKVVIMVMRMGCG